MYMLLKVLTFILSKKITTENAIVELLGGNGGT